jgi:hypothetical protein
LKREVDIPLLVRKDRSGSGGGCFASPQVTGLEISFGIAVKRQHSVEERLGILKNIHPELEH